MIIVGVLALTTKLISLPKWQGEFNAGRRNKLNVVELDLEYFIKPKQTEECNGVNSEEQAAGSAPSPIVDAIFGTDLFWIFRLRSVVLNLKVFVLVVEVIQGLEDLLLII